MAVMVVVPAAMIVARPLPLIVATDVSEELQVTWAVTSWVVPSEYVPAAANCWVFSVGIVRLAGVNDMEDKGGADALSFDESPPPPQAVSAIKNIIGDKVGNLKVFFFMAFLPRQKNNHPLRAKTR
jgi:hypothetical protein